MRTAIAVLVLVPALVLVCIGAILHSWTGATPRRLQWAYQGFSRLCIAVGGTRLCIEGARHARPGEAYVIVSNHASNWDPVCIIVALPQLVIRFVVKDALMKIPVFGPALERTGNVRVVRNRTSADVERLRESMSHRDPSVSMLFFAEGTRSADGSLQPFKMGAFATAIATGLPVLPVALSGTEQVWPRGHVEIRPDTVAIEIGEPIPTRGLVLAQRAELRDRCFEAVRRLHERARERRRATCAGADGAVAS